MNARPRLSGAMASRIPAVVGEGALAGLVAGSMLGAWDVILNGDLRHRMVMLAAWRMLRVAPAAVGLGIAASILLAALLGALHRLGKRILLAGTAGMVLSALLGAVLATWTQRSRFFPLHLFSSRALAVAAVLPVVLSAAALLIVRILDELPGGNAPRWSSMSRARRFTGCLGMALGALTVILQLVYPTLAEERARGRPSVILVSFDTMRGDRLGALGYPRPLTRNLDRLASEGALFEQAGSAASWTLPSHVSLFSSLLPFDHRAQWDHSPIQLKETFPAEHFREVGYHCAAFTGGGYLSHHYGFSQGFEVYQERDEVKEGGPEGIAASALAWARAHRQSPFFLFVHTYECHAPYTHDQFAGPEKVGRIGSCLDDKLNDAIHEGKAVLTVAERARVRDLYDGDVANADRVIGGMLETLQREGILDHAILAVVSDHGEDFWDHDQTWSPGHGHSLYQEILHVLLFFRAPGRIPPGLRIRVPVSLLDVAPTLLALAGLPPDPAYQGRDLSASCLLGTEPTRVPIFAESMQVGPNRFAVRQGNLKVILAPMPERKVSGNVIDKVAPLEVFDLATDPGERHNLADAMPDSARPLVRLAWERANGVLLSGGPLTDRNSALPRELKEQLRSLGYIN